MSGVTFFGMGADVRGQMSGILECTTMVSNMSNSSISFDGHSRIVLSPLLL